MRRLAYLCAPLNPAGIRNSDWYHIIGGDGFQTRVDPTDPNILYSQSQYGYLNRYNKQTNEQVQILPQPKSGEAPLRWHWNSPLLISPHQSNRLYFAANNYLKVKMVVTLGWKQVAICQGKKIEIRQK